jgi:hypothetical protein
MPLTLLTTLLCSIMMFTSWAVVGKRLGESPETGNRQARLLQSFFLFMGLFFVSVFTPHILLETAPENFPLGMALGYVIGHIFLYIAFYFIGRLLFSMVPRLENKTYILTIFSSVAIPVLTLLNTVTMIWGKRPEFSSEFHVTILNAHPGLGAAIGIYSLLTILPTALLLIKNGVTNDLQRSRSFMLGFGLLILVVMGSLHDVSPNGYVFMAADIGTILGTFLITGGVLHHIDQKISVARTAHA